MIPPRLAMAEISRNSFLDVRLFADGEHAEDGEPLHHTKRSAGRQSILVVLLNKQP